MIALLDNTVLSNFAAIERPDLVRLALGNDAATTEAVWAEFQAGIRIAVGCRPRAGRGCRSSH